jgi:hypothetical protein
VISERDLLVFFRALALGFLSSFDSLLQSTLNCNRGKRHQLCGGPCGEVLFPVDLRRESSLGPRDRLREGRVKKDPAFVASSTGSRFARTEPR